MNYNSCSALSNILCFFSLLFLTCISTSELNSQCTGTFTIFTEDFEDNGNTVNAGSGRYASLNDFYDSSSDDDYWGRVEGSTELYYLTNTSSGFIANTNVPYTGWNGNFYYAGEDLDDTGGSVGTPDGVDTKEILFSGLNINGATNMCFSGLFARGENDGCGSSTYDNDDYINVYYNIDGAGEVLAMCFNPDLECNIPMDVSNEPLHHDPNCDGDGGEGAVLTNTLTEFIFLIGGTGTSMDLRIEVHMDAGSEEVAIDFLNVMSDTELISVMPTLSIVCPANNFGLPLGCNPTVPAAATTFNVAGDPAPNPALPTVSGGIAPLILTFTDVITDIGCSQTVTRTYRVTDDNGDFAECDQTFTYVVDTDDPVFDLPVPMDMTVECDAIPAVAMPTATDNCTSFVAGGDPWINEIHYDNFGTDTGEFIEIAGPAGTSLAGCTLELYNGSNGTVYNTIALSGAIPDEGAGCGAIAFTLPSNGLQNGSPDGIALVCGGVVLEFISYEGVIFAMNGPAAGMLSTDIGVTEPGAIGESLQLTGSGCGSSDFAWQNPAAQSPGSFNTGQTCDCAVTGAIDFVESFVPDAACPNAGVLTRTWTATDQCGNAADLVQVITIEDNTPPMFCEPFTDTNIDAECDAIPVPLTFSAFDNCGSGGASANVWVNEFHYDNTGADTGEFIEIAGNAGANLAGYNLELYNGNGGGLFQTIPLSGIIPSEVCGFGALSFATVGLMNGSPDGFALVDPGGVVLEFWSYEGSFTATGGAANGMMSVDVGVSEPGTTPVGQSLQLIGTGATGAAFAWTGPVVASPGAINDGQMLEGDLPITFTETDNQGTTGCSQHSYTITRTWEATDGCGNTSTRTQQINVEDNMPPEVTCQDITVSLDPSGMVTIDPMDLISMVSDNCSAVADLTITADQTEFSCADCGASINVIVTVADECGNDMQCAAEVTIMDGEAPMAVCQDVTIFLDENGVATLTPEMVDNGSTDNCGIASITLDQTMFSCMDIGGNCNTVVPVTMTVMDNCGMSAMCVANITIQDTIAPVISGCEGDRFINLQGGECGEIYSFADLFAVDNCEGVMGTTFLGTTFIDDNGFAGNMFDITNIGTSPITITMFDIHFETAAGTPHTAEVWYTTTATTYMGNETNAAAWTSMGSSATASAGPGNPTPLVVGGLTIAPGQSYGLYVAQTDGGSNLDYTNGTAANMMFSDANIQLDLGAGKGNPIFTGGTFSPRIWNGNIHYEFETGNMTTLTQIEGPESGSFLCYEDSPYTFTFEADDGCGNVSSCTWTVGVVEYVPSNNTMACNDQINLSMDANCEALITADMLLEGSNYGCFGDFVLTSSLGGTAVPTMCGDGNDLLFTNLLGLKGNEIIVEVFNPDNGNSCWSTIIIEDKLPPVLEPNTPLCELNTLAGVFDANDPTFMDVPCWDFDGTAPNAGTSFDQLDFIAPCSGMFTFCMTDSDLFDGIAAIYEGSFDPLDPCGANPPLAGDDDITDAAGAQIFESEPCFAVSLTAGTNYVLVSSTWGAGQEGMYEWTFTGPCALNTPCMLKCYDLDAVLADDFAFPPPNVEECGSFTMTKTDWLDNTSCDVTLLKRTWTATDMNGNSSTLVQEFLFEALDINTDIILPKSPVILNCGAGTDPADIMAWFDDPMTEDDPCTPPLDPSLTVEENNEGNMWAWPTFMTIGCDGEEHSQAIKDNICSINVTYTDLVLDACNAGCNTTNKKIIRTWTILDWCEAQNGNAAGSTITFDQVIKAVDNNEPTIQVTIDNQSTEAWGCNSNFTLPIPELHDGCDSDLTWSAHGSPGVFVYQNAAGEWEVEAVKSGMDPVTGDLIPHVITYSAEDCCKNVGTLDVEFFVFDGAPPVAIANQNLVISLTSSGNGGDGFAKIFAENVDNGSFDGCGAVKLEIRRDDGNKNNLSCGIPGNNSFNHDHSVHIGDGNLNPNSTHYDPDDGKFVTFCCEDAGNEIKVWLRVWDDGNMDGCVGCAVPGVAMQDNYNDTWVTILVEDKGTPQIVCPPDITVPCGWDWETQTESATAYNNCGPVEVSRSVNDNGINNCGLGVIRVTYCVTPEPDAGPVCCLQRITIEDSGSDWDPNGINFQNDNPNLGCNNIPVPTQPQWGEGHCDLIGWTSSDQDFWFEDGACRKVIRTYEVINWCLDALGDPTALVTHQTKFAVVDNVDPFLDGANVMFAVDNATDLNENCAADEVILKMTGTDGASNCESEWLEWKVEVDLWSDGSIDVTYDYAEGADDNFNPNFDFDQDGVWYLPKSANGEEIEITLPGEVASSCNNHTVVWTVNDGCNNITSLTEDFMVVDKKPPTPYCISTSSAVMPSKGYVELWATDFDLSSFDNCNEVLISFSATEYLQNMEFTCAMDTDGDGIIIVPIYVWDLTSCYANVSSCEVELTLSNCDDSTTTRMIAGEVATEFGEMVESVEVVVNSAAIMNYPVMDMTNTDGGYAFPYNIETFDYEVASQRDDDYMNGISTLDLVLIQKHILNIQALDSPYKMIAADINNSKTISAIDLVELRKLILGIYLELPDNDSWRMIDAAQNLTTANPWIFTEVIHINNLSSDMMDEDFIGVKIGDVNQSVEANATSVTSESRSNSALRFEVEEKALKAGEKVSIDIMSANYTEVNGYQFTMDFKGMTIDKVTSGSHNVSNANYALSERDDNSIMAMSYHSADAETSTKDEVLFTIELTANASGNLSEMLSINSNVTRAEAYLGTDLEIVNIDLGIRTEDEVEILAAYELLQNEPNPFNGKTQIGFSLPQAANATITVYDVTGKVIMTRSQDYQKGLNTVELTRKELGAISGILYYQLESGDFTATKKMIVIE